MTCIAGIVEKGKVYIGGDSAGVSGLDLTVRADEKVFCKDEFVFGFTSSFRMGQLLRYKFKPPLYSPNKGIMEYMVADFVEEIRNCLVSGGYAQRKDNVDTGGVFLIGYKGNLFTVESDFQIGQARDNFMAVGCGEDYAKGVFWELRNSKIKAKDKVLRALEAAEHFSGGVCRPFIIKEV